MRQALKSGDIDGFTYEVKQLGAKDGRRLLTQVAKLALPVLGALLKGVDLEAVEATASGNEGQDGAESFDRSKLDIDVGELAAAVAAAADEKTVDAICDRLAAVTLVYGPDFGDAGAPLERHFDEHFAARYGAMIRWLGFALKVQFGDFFGGKGSVGKLVAGLRSPGPGSASPST